MISYAEKIVGLEMIDKISRHLFIFNVRTGYFRHVQADRPARQMPMLRLKKAFGQCDATVVLIKQIATCSAKDALFKIDLVTTIRNV